jgi:hypothetical protein
MSGDRARGNGQAEPMMMSKVLRRTKRAVRQRILRSRNLLNIVRYGPSAPRYAERIWVEPHTVRFALHGPGHYIACSGRVAAIEERLKLVDLKGTPRISSCYAHWVDGVPWNETRDYQATLKAVRNGKKWARCSTEQELIERFQALDRIFEETRKSRRLKTRKELDPTAYREEGGVLICLGKGGEPLLYNGFHRFAMSLILELPVIPAQLGYVDRSALGSLERFRHPPAEVARSGA